MKIKCADCGKQRTGGQACEHCGTCPECGSLSDQPPSFFCYICDRGPAKLVFYCKTCKNVAPIEPDDGDLEPDEGYQLGDTDTCDMCPAGARGRVEVVEERSLCSTPLECFGGTHKSGCPVKDK